MTLSKLAQWGSRTLLGPSPVGLLAGPRRLVCRGLWRVTVLDESNGPPRVWQALEDPHSWRVTVPTIFGRPHTSESPPDT